MEKLGAGDPQRIGAYRLLARLGAGGMGQVYLARSDRGRTVAVKLVRQQLAEQDEFRARFRQEVQAARRVGGHWTAPVLDADTEADIPWVATGYVAGPTLQTVVGSDHGALPERSVRILAAGLAHALQDIHAAGLIHRDLKPSNVLVTIDGPRVIDFGIARALETVTDGGLTRTGALVGSPGFMAPEQVRGDRVTPACDVFCLGSVLAYAATGALPFGTASSGVHALMFRIAQEEPDLTGVPEGLADLVRECLRKDPAARPPLERILERTGAEDTVADGRSRDPWLPSALVAQLGRHAVRLLDAEDPETDEEPEAPSADTPQRTPRSTGAAPATRPPPPSTPSPPRRPPPLPPRPRPRPRTPTSRSPRPTRSPSPTPRTTSPTTPGPAYNTPLPPAYFTQAPAPAPARRSAGATVALVAVAIVVAIGAGGSVYAFMNNEGRRYAHQPRPAPPHGRTTTATGTGNRRAAAVPGDYLGTWTGSIPGDRGASSRKLVIRQGGVGDQVLSLTAEGPLALGATYHCEFTAPLAARPGDGEPVRIGPSTVSVGRPAASCSPGKPTELTLLPDGTLRRAAPGSGESLIYTRSD